LAIGIFKFKVNANNSFNFLGAVRKIVHPFLYIMVTLSYFIMEMFIKFKTQSHNLDSNLNETNLNRSLPVSLSIALSVALHLVSDFVAPKLIKGPDHIALKILFSNFWCYIFIPFMIIWFNPNIHVYAAQQLQNNVFFRKSLNAVMPTVAAS